MNNRFLKNTSWILLGQVVRIVVSFLVGVLTVRYLGPSNFGILNYVASYLSFFTAIVGLGLNGVIIYEFVNHKGEDGNILGTAILLRLLLGIICTVILYLIVLTIDGGDSTILLVTVLQSIQLPFLCLDTINYWYQYRLQSKYPVIAQTLAYILMSVYKVFLLITGKDVVWFAFATSLDVIILGISYFGIWFKQHINPLKWDKTIAKRIMRSCSPFILANVMVVIYGQVDKIMIKHMIGSVEDVGLYSAAVAICSYIGFLPVAILDSARPIIAEAKNISEDLYQLRFRQLVAGIIWICFAYSFFITLLSPFIISLLYGKDFLNADLCLKITVWYTAFSYLGSARSFWLICENKNKYVFVFSAMGALGNVLLNLFLITIWGKEGAALSTLLTQIFANFLFPAIFKDTRQYSGLVVNGFFLRNINISAGLSHIRKHFSILRGFYRK